MDDVITHTTRSSSCLTPPLSSFISKGDATSFPTVSLSSRVASTSIAHSDLSVHSGSISDSSCEIRPSPSFRGTVEPIHLDRKSLKKSYIEALKINLLLVVPGLGLIAFLIAHLAIRIMSTYNKPSAEELKLIKSMKDLSSGLSDARIKKLVRFITEKSKGHVAGESRLYLQSQFMGFAGTLPRDVIEMPDGRFVIKVYTRIVGTDQETIHRGIIVDPRSQITLDNPSSSLVGYVHILEKKDSIEILDPYAAHIFGTEEDIKPVDCFIVNNQSDLSQLYPKNIERAEDHEYVDIAFHAYQKRSSPVDHIVSIGENVGSWGNVNRGIVHVDMIQGRHRVTETTKNPDGSVSTRQKDYLIIASATGVHGTFLEYKLDPTDSSQLPDGAELHIFRFKKSDFEGFDSEQMLRAMHQFARRQVNQISLPSPAIATESDTHMASSYHYGFIPGLYSNTDAAYSPFSSIRYREDAIDRVALAAADELLEQRRHTIDNTQILGGICSSFASLTLQIGRFLGAFTQKDKETIVAQAEAKARKDISSQFDSIEEKILKSSGISKADFEKKYMTALTDEKTGTWRNGLITQRYVSLLTLLSDKIRERHLRTPQGQAPVTKDLLLLKEALDKLYRDEYATVMKRHLFHALKDLILNAEKKLDENSTELERNLHSVVKDPIFRLHSRWMLPSTLHGLMIRHMTRSVQIVPPRAPEEVSVI